MLCSLFLSTAVVATSALPSALTTAHIYRNHYHPEVQEQLYTIHVMKTHRDLVSSDVSSSDHTCPVCRMSTLENGYNNDNYVVMENGQLVYTCGMMPRPFTDYTSDLTDTAYLAANMAEFIVSQADQDVSSVCTNTCDECTNNIRDPVSSEAITNENFVYVCLRNGQKIYFASKDSRNTYLDHVNTKPRYMVNDVVCSGSTCSDATTVTSLSLMAQNFVPDTASVDASGAPATAVSSSTTADTSSSSLDFCSGQGSVMFNGFQTSIHGSCVMLLFRPWVLNSGVKYAFGFIGCFFIALLNELLVKEREVERQRLLTARKLRPHDNVHKMQCNAVLAVLYMIQMTIAYFAMLVVMTYETGLFLALIAGFGVGYLLFKNLDQDIAENRGSWRFTDPSTVRIPVEGMSCMKSCGLTVENALKNTLGVTDAVVEVDERAAYVSGSVQYSDLVAAIEAVGFTVEANDQNGRNSHTSFKA